MYVLNFRHLQKTITGIERNIVEMLQSSGLKTGLYRCDGRGFDPRHGICVLKQGLLFTHLDIGCDAKCINWIFSDRADINANRLTKTSATKVHSISKEVSEHLSMLFRIFI